jgi:hypothetical protein
MCYGHFFLFLFLRIFVTVVRVVGTVAIAPAAAHRKFVTERNYYFFRRRRAVVGVIDDKAAAVTQESAENAGA